MSTELILRKDGILVKAKFRNPLTGIESPHDVLVPYSALRPNMNMLGIQDFRPIESGKDLEIGLKVENFSMEKMTTELTGLRKGTRIERIASFLIQHKGEAYTTKELTYALNDNDRANVQWEATRLIREHSGYKTTKKNGLLAYMYTG